VGALDLDRFELRILDHEVSALGDLVAAAFLLRGDRLVGLFIEARYLATSSFAKVGDR
jgi:hypothetical protein